MRTGKWVILDCDDVMLDIMKAFSRHVTEDLGIPVTGMPGSWQMGAWMGMSDEEALERIFQFNENHLGFGDLQPVDGAVDGARMIKEAGYQIAVATASSTGDDSKARRIANIDRHFEGCVDEIHFVPLGQSKKGVLSMFPPSVFVDDAPKNAIVGAEVGHTSVLFPAHHNVDAISAPPKGVIAVSGWSGVLELIPGVRNDQDLRM